MQKPKRKVARQRAKTARSRKPSSRKTLHKIRFPNENARYRTARNSLLNAERDLRRQIEKVAAMRRKLPVGGVIAQDYVFEEGAADPSDVHTTRRVKLSELFGDQDTLVAYSYMYGPNMEKPCPMCTAILDALDGVAQHVGRRASFVVIARSPIGRIRDIARSRGWNGLRLLSSANNTYNADYQGENESDDQLPSLNVFVRRNGKIHHFYNTELLFLASDKDQESRHVDMIAPLWNMLDFTPEGRGKTWFPKLSYAA